MSRVSRDRVLVVDGDLAHGRLLCDAIRSWGYWPILAGSITEALEVAEGWRPDIVLADLLLPDGDGYGLAAELTRQLGERPLFAALATLDAPHELARARGVGYGVDFVKPVPFSPLRDWLEMVGEPTAASKG